MNHTTDPTRPEVDDPRVLALAKARQQLAHDNPFNAACPPWDGLTEREQHLSLLDARSYLHAALRAGLVAQPPAVLPVSSSRAVLLEAADWFDRGGRSVARLFGHQVATELRRLAAEQPTNTETETPEPETEERVVRAHVTTLHLIGEQLAGIESWMWERLADVRDAARPAVVEQPDIHTPRRGDLVDAWLKRQRDDHDSNGTGDHEMYDAIDSLLDLYRLHADTGTPLSGHVCEGRVIGDCGCLEQPDTETTDAPPREPHPTQADMDHALTVWARFRGQDAGAPDTRERPDTQTREARPECAHCWREIENRGTPSMDGNHYVHWVHVPGGFTVCFPHRGADSPRAEPRAGDAS